MSASMASMMPILQSLMQLAPKVDEIQAAPQIDNTMIQQQSQGGLFSGMQAQGQAPSDIMSALLAQQGGSPVGNTGALAKAQMAYEDTQSSRLPGIAGGLEGMVDMFRAGGKRKALGDEMQTAADAMYAEKMRLEQKADAEKSDVKDKAESVATQRGDAVFMMAQAGKLDPEIAKQLGILAYGDEKIAQKLAEQLSTKEGQTALMQNIKFAQEQGANISPQEIGQAALDQGKNVTTIMNPLAGYYLRDANNQPMRDENGALMIDPGSKEALDLQMAQQKYGDEKTAAAEEKSDKEWAATVKTRNKIMEMDNAMEQIQNTMRFVGPGTTGLLGFALNFVPGTDATMLTDLLKTQKGGLAFAELKQMREESKTGGALGNVSNVELDLLEKAYVALSTAKPEELKRALIDLTEKFEAVKYGLENEERFRAEGYTEAEMRAAMNRHVNNQIAGQMKISPEALEEYYKSEDPNRAADFVEVFGWRPRGL